MIRIFKLAAAYAAIGLLYARYRLNFNGVGPDQIRELGQAEMSEERCAQVLKVIEFIDSENQRGVLAPPTVDDILDTLLPAITADPPPDVSLIDKLGAFLRQPFGINLIGVKMVSQLRKALLSSAEYDVLQELISRKEHSCSSCNHTFRHGEGAYFSGAGQVQLLCFRCSLPSYSSCMTCEDGIVSIGSNIRNSLASSKQSCQECKEKKAAELRAAANPIRPQDHLQGAGGGIAVDIEVGRDPIFQQFIENIPQDDPQAALRNLMEMERGVVEWQPLAGAIPRARR